MFLGSFWDISPTGFFFTAGRPGRRKTHIHASPRISAYLSLITQVAAYGSPMTLDIYAHGRKQSPDGMA
jgi:hypothetical protein